jgi:hypothetical protein
MRAAHTVQVPVDEAEQRPLPATLAGSDDGGSPVLVGDTAGDTPITLVTSAARVAGTRQGIISGCQQIRPVRQQCLPAEHPAIPSGRYRCG